jgi:hypothetical protein
MLNHNVIFKILKEIYKDTPNIRMIDTFKQYGFSSDYFRKFLIDIKIIQNVSGSSGKNAVWKWIYHERPSLQLAKKISDDFENFRMEKIERLYSKLRSEPAEAEEANLMMDYLRWKGKLTK